MSGEIFFPMVFLSPGFPANHNSAMERGSSMHWVLAVMGVPRVTTLSHTNCTKSKVLLRK